MKYLELKKGQARKKSKPRTEKQVKKYHPDRHQDNPLYELAEEKLQEINEAYEYLTNNGKGGYESFGGGSGKPNGYQNPNTEFGEVRRMIDRGNLQGAEATLNRIKTKKCGVVLSERNGFPAQGLV